MADAELAPVGAPCWIDLFTTDAAGARTFYESLFGWQAEEPNPDFGGYFNFTLGGRRVAGCMAKDPHSDEPQGPDAWSVYLRTNDAEKTVAAGEANGGQTIVPAMPVGDLGSMAVVIDSTQAAIGTWQPGTHLGFGVANEPGAPAWFELHTRDFDAALAYYREVFGWDSHLVSDTPEFRYATFGVDDAAKAGIADAATYLPDGIPSHWAVYIAVADADAAMATVVERGGSVLMPVEDTPFGRLATALDPTGAMFKVMQPTP